MFRDPQAALTTTGRVGAPLPPLAAYAGALTATAIAGTDHAAAFATERRVSPAGAVVPASSVESTISLPLFGAPQVPNDTHPGPRDAQRINNS
ncbi:hypothetical protein ARHIZOSPH14_19090 [Agromyces rhizosphaerae]|uniref:Uncharacterized protein n=1 Tax=Agromyces rhizosphaerae TaxID=88374 RepID=A0A9W6CYQ4_9MICO|nr:hypothetical protein ARHIZOSPH14_19090 [Agromyces rhizosphaerae]